MRFAWLVSVTIAALGCGCSGVVQAPRANGTASSFGVPLAVPKGSSTITVAPAKPSAGLYNIGTRQKQSSSKQQVGPQSKAPTSVPSSGAKLATSSSSFPRSKEASGSHHPAVPSASNRAQNAKVIDLTEEDFRKTGNSSSPAAPSTSRAKPSMYPAAQDETDGGTPSHTPPSSEPNSIVPVSSPPEEAKFDARFSS